MPAVRAPRTPRISQVNFRLPADLKQALRAAAGVLGKSQESLLTVALRKYLAGLPDGTKKLIQQSMALQAKQPPP